MLIAIISLILGSFIGWLISSYYYQKSKNDLESQNNILQNKIGEFSNELSRIDSNNRLVIFEKRIEQGRLELRRKGTPEFFINTLTDLSQQEKFNLYEQIFIREKGRLPTANPYKND